MSPRGQRALVLLCLAWLAGCRALHEASIKQRLVPTRFFSRDVHRPLADVELLLGDRQQQGPRTWCELCVLSAQPRDGGQEFCLSSHLETTCLVARAAGPGLTRFSPAEPDRVSAQVVRALWALLEPEVLAAAELSDDETLAAMARDEEEHFTPRWSFTAGAKVGSVISYDPPSFTFGGHVGFRRWASPVLIGGAALELENLVQPTRSMVAGALLGRFELTLWASDNPRFWNLPRVAFVAGAGPLVGFGRAPGLGGRSVLGIHLVHLGPFVTPFFFELGFQALVVDEQSSTGLRVALGLGF
ncbi:MAG: hypothetical protein ACOZQL_16500 [Myxococcota bacterium]